VLNEAKSAQVHVTTSRRDADIRAAAAIADRLQARVTISRTSPTGPSARGKARGWVSHHRSRGGVGEVIKQVAAHGPKQAKHLAKRAVVRRSSARTVHTPTLESLDQPESVRCHILVGVSPSQLLATQNAEGSSETNRTIELTIGPRFWWDEPWQPALAHRNIQLLRVTALVTERGQAVGHLVRWLTVAVDDTAKTVAARFSEVAAEVCADLVLDDPPLLPGEPTEDSPLSERIVAQDSTTFDSVVWTDLIRSITRF